MQVKCFIIYAVFCILGIVLASPEEQLETLLRKPFWNTLISKFGKKSIFIENQQFQITELFGTVSNPAIVDNTNVNVKIRQFYHLLINVYSFMLFYYLRFFKIIEYQHEVRNQPLNIINVFEYIKYKFEFKNVSLDSKNEILNLIDESKPTLAMMVTSVWFLKGLYKNEVKVPIDSDPSFLETIYFFIHLNTPDVQKFYSYLKSLWNYLGEILTNNNHAAMVIQSIIDIEEINDYIRFLNHGDYSPDVRIEHLKKFRIMNDTFLKKIEEIGFQYNESTHSASSILEKLTELYHQDVCKGKNLK